MHAIITPNKRLKSITTPELALGHIVHYYGARFVIISTRLVPDLAPDNSGPIMVAMGKWLDGSVMSGYFGPHMPEWNFQGNRNARVLIETPE